MRRRYHLYPIALLLLFFFIIPDSQAQNFSGHTWYFGNNNLGVRFSRGDNTASAVTNPGGALNTGGSAVASDPISGTVLFYTNGSQVFDVTGAVMPNGTGLNVNAAANQPVVVSLIPGTTNQYYIFTISAAGEVFQHVVDMSIQGNAVPPAPPLGDVTASNISLGLTNRSEAMTIVPHDNGTDYWLITQEAGTSNYAVTLIDDSFTFPTTVYSGVGFSMTAANFAYNASSGQIAVSPQSTNVDIHILNFNDATGLLSFDQTIPNTAVLTAGAGAYDVEWSNNGQYLYISFAGGAGVQADVLQFDLLNPSTTLASVLPQPNAIFRSWGLQMGPDSTIYHLYQATNGGPFLLGAITNTDTVATAVTYNPSAFPGNFNGRQFPQFLPTSDQTITVSFTSSGICSNSPTSFFPQVSPAADSLVWNFDDGFGSSDWSPIYTYENGGTYNVSVTAYLNGQSETFSQPVDITQFDLQINLVQDTTACSCELPFPLVPNPPDTCPPFFSVTATLQGGNGDAVWSNGDLGLTLTPDSAGYYYVTVTDPNTGCVAYAGVNIREYGLQEQRANIWHFGQNAGIDFNPLPDGPPVAISGPVNSPEGAAAISDRNGQIIFSTDGQTIYDKNGVDITPEPNPPGLGGEPGATQSVLIMPVPGDETLYYIFTTQEVHGTNTYELRYSLFDVKLNNGDGGIVEYNVLLHAPSTERITGSDNWLIAHEYGNNTFRAYEITSNGIGNPVISGVGSDHSVASAENGQGYMKLSSDGKLAVAISTPGSSNVIEIFDFNDSTGVVSNPRIANLNNPNGQVYGIEFSPGGNKLFATLKGTPSPSIIYEFVIDSLGNVTYEDNFREFNNEELGALQIGPDGQIYVAANGQGYLYTFSADEDIEEPTDFALMQQFPLAVGSTSTLGLPNFIQTISTPIQGPGIAVSGVCLGSPTTFSGVGTDPNIDMFQWQFGDGAGSTDQETEHTYAAAGTYNVSLRITNRCGLDITLFQTITIVAPPADPTFLPAGQNTAVLCTGELTLEATPANNPNLANLNFLWSTGETTREITVNQQADYSVTITDNNGCTSDGSLVVADNRPIVNLGPDQTLCQNTPVAPLNAQNPGAVYQWQINGANSGTSQTQSVDSSLPGVFTYSVEVTDPITNCVVDEEVIFTFNQSPEFTAIANAASDCGVPDASIDINIVEPSASIFSYSVTGPVVDNGVDLSAGLHSTPSTLLPGTYGVTVFDQVSGCATITTVSINDNTFDVSVLQAGNCDPIPIEVTTTPTVQNFAYRIIDVSTGATMIPPGTVVGSSLTPFLTDPVVSGTYVVEVRENIPGGCVASSDPITIQQGPTIDIDFDLTDICDGIVEAVSTPPGATFDWSASQAGAIIGATNQPSVTLNPSPTPWNLVVTATNAGPECPATESITVTVDNNIIPAITQGDACSDQVIITAAPNGAFLYRWYRNGALDLTLGGPQAVATPANNGQDYRVELYNPVSGCTRPSNTINVAAIGTISLALSATQACQGSPFTITATPSQPVPGNNYTWAFNQLIIGGQTTSELTDTRGGTYRATVTVSGCTADADIQILLLPSTPGNLPSGAIICNDPANTDPETNQVLLNPGENFVAYNWLYNGVPLGVTDQTLIATEEGTYSVELTNTFDCVSTDQTIVTIECVPKITGPNAFRPGGLNSDFFLYTFFIDDSPFEVFIFSRWGELIYQSNSRDFRWNGGYNNSEGKPLPPGTYSYVVKYKSSYRPEKGIEEKRGGVVLLR